MSEDTLTQEEFDAKARRLKLTILENTASKLAQEGEAAKAQARLTSAVARTNEIAAAQGDRQETANLAADIYHQRYYFTEAIDPKSIKQCIQQCTYWANSKPGCDITIIFNCQGGEVFHGMMLVDFLRELVDRGHCVRIGTYGLAASMAGILLQAASPGHRYVGREAWTLIHEPSTTAQGTAAGMRDAAKFSTDMANRIRNIFLANARRALEGTGKTPMTEEEFDAKWQRQDWWLSSEQMLELGFADKIGSPLLAAPSAPETPVDV